MKAFEFDDLGNVAGIKPLEYEVAFGATRSELGRVVAERINGGGELVGGVAVCPEISGTAHSRDEGFYQALLRNRNGNGNN